jgi:hypothetical protein
MWGYSVSGSGLTCLSKRASSLLLGAAIAVLGFISAPAFAGPHVPFSVNGTIMMIDTGDVKPAGQSGRFIVRDRHITGTFTGSISAPFVITFDTNVPIATQSGRIHGRLIAGVYEANVTMASSTGATPVECETPDGATCIATPGGNFVPGLLLNGRMNFLSGAKGQGSVTGWLIPVIDDQGHIVNILASQLAISGQWMQ